MKVDTIKVLLIEDDEDDVLLAKEHFSRIRNFDFQVDWESSPLRARQRIVDGEYDVFIIDYLLNEENGLELVKFIQHKKILTPSIILTGQDDLKVEVDASNYGASDFLVKSDLSPSLLERTIRYAISRAKIVKELDEKEKRYRSLFERSIDPIFLVNQKLALSDVNDSFLSFFGYSNKEIEKVSLQNIFADSKDYEYFISKLHNNEPIREFELLMLTSTGDTKICLLNCVYIPDGSSDSFYYQGIIHDLTDRKRAEEDMLIAERFSITGKIARIIAHEVRNPLTNLTLAFEQLMDEPPETNDSRNLFADIIRRNIKRIGQLVDEMLNSSNPKEFHFELTPMSVVLNEAVDLALDRISLNQIKFHKNISDDLPMFFLDKDKIKIALLNIMINAIEAMTPGKGILTMSATNNNGKLTIVISDNGKGIAADALPKLFDPFFSAKQTGMGLGLTATKNILNRHGAQIDVKSKLNEGTSFHIEFKLEENK